MSALAQRPHQSEIEKVLIGGDLARLTPEQRVTYYNETCKTLGLNPLTRPFDYITLQGKMTLYARKDATEQLRKIHGVSIKIAKAEQVGGLFIVVAEATDKNGRHDSSTGAVAIDGLKGDALANAFLKCETKAKRRVTLSICGLGMLDESEVDSIPREHREVAPEPKHIEPVAREAQKAFPSATVKEVPVEATEASSVGSYVPTFGKYRGQPISNFDLKDLQGYVAWIKKSALDTGKPIQPNVAEFIRAVEAYQAEQEDMGDLKF